MNFMKAIATVFVAAVITASCGEISTEPPEIIPSDSPEAVMDDSSWEDIYSEILSGRNELGIDFTDYNVGDESDVTEIRSYRGCGLYDLDEDGAPELFVRIGLYEGEFYHLFTIGDNAGKYIGESAGRLIEKPTGILFNVAGETGYMLDVAYEYDNGSLVEIPGYVQPIPENYAEVVLGEKTVDLGSEDILQVNIYDSLAEAADNY